MTKLTGTFKVFTLVGSLSHDQDRRDDAAISTSREHAIGFDSIKGEVRAAT
jgi:hypothetical protein